MHIIQRILSLSFARAMVQGYYPRSSLSLSNRFSLLAGGRAFAAEASVEGEKWNQ